ncbi:hypothetical protein [Melissospora conviva]|uniref:hypothetical protein n=1 Tax=Melissospora conviva TaxID=3388432 RepID=UPI003C13AACD
MRYRTRCHEFDAIRVTSDNLDEIRKFAGPHATVEQQKIPGPGRGMTDGITIRTINDTVRVRVGDWVTRDDPPAVKDES